MKRILIVEDDIELCQEVVVLLERSGYEAQFITDFNDTLKNILDYNGDLVLLDINIPGVDGQSILRQLRKYSDVPVIMLTSKNTEMDEMLCLSFGADDFVAKPYNPSMLLLHIEVVLKRAGKTENNNIISYRNVVLDIGRGVLKISGNEVDLSKNEMKILGFMIKNQGRIVSRDELISYLWDSEEFVDDNTLTVNINRVRKKLEDNGCGDFIKTKRGQGYILE